MRYLSLLTAFLTSLVSITAAEAAFQKTFQSGNWEGLTYYSDDGAAAFSFCAANTPYNNGYTLSLALLPNGLFSLMFLRAKDFAEADTRVALFGDEKPIYSGRASIEGGGKVLRLDVSAEGTAIEAIKSASILRLAYDKANVAFSVPGTAAAISALSKCVADHGGATRSPSPSTVSTQARPDGVETIAGASDGPRVIPREQLIPSVMRILTYADVTNYRFLPASTGEASHAVTWVYEDGSIGSMIAVEKAGGFDLNREGAEITAAATVTCNGDFATGKRAPRFVNGVELRKVVASCSAGADSFYAEYSLVRLPAGLLIKLTSAYFGANSMPGANGDGGKSGRERAALTEEATLATFLSR